MHLFISNYDCNLPWGNDLNFNLYYLSMLPYNWYKPQNAFFFWWVLPHLHYYSLRLILLSHGEHKLIMGLDRSCKYGTGSWKKKKDGEFGDLRLSKRLGFELQYHPLNKGAFFICTCILLHEILVPHLMTSLGTKHSFLILGRQSSLSGVFKRL